MKPWAWARTPHGDASPGEVHQAAERLHAPRRIGQLFNTPSTLWGA